MPAASCAGEKKTSICICTCICTFVPVKPVKLSTERPEVARRVVLRREEGLLQNASGHKDAVGRVAGATKKKSNTKEKGEKNQGEKCFFVGVRTLRGEGLLPKIEGGKKYQRAQRCGTRRLQKLTETTCRRRRSRWGRCSPSGEFAFFFFYFLSLFKTTCRRRRSRWGRCSPSGAGPLFQSTAGTTSVCTTQTAGGRS